MMESARTEAESEAPRVQAQAQIDAGAPAAPTDAPETPARIASPVSPASSLRSLKRSADMMDDDEERQDTKRKRLSDDNANGGPLPADGTDANRLVEDIGLELSCGCCAALCYNPVILLPCQHYYCGSCYTLWTRQGGANCPSCRSPVSSIIPSRAIQALIETYLRSVPSRARIQREKEQADEIYTAGQTISVPTPRPRSPEVAVPLDNDAYYRPCPHCPSPNEFNWTCPDPIIDPAVDVNRARLLTDGIPPGHAKCGNCEHLHAIRAPTTSRCDFCLNSFCGLVSPTRCHARRLREAHPAGMETLMDILGNSDVYEAFGINAIEFDYMLDYLREHDITPRFIYMEIVRSLVNTNDGWRPLLDRGIFPAVTEQSQAEVAPPVPVDPPAPERVLSSPPPVVVETLASDPEPLVTDATLAFSQAQERGVQTDDVIVTPVPPPPTVEIAQMDIAAPLPVPVSISTETGPARNNDMIVETVPVPVVLPIAAVEPRPPTPLAVPEREPTPPSSVPEPTLDILPVDVESRQVANNPSSERVPVTGADGAPPVTSAHVLTSPSEDRLSSPSSDRSSSHLPENESPSSPPVPAVVPGSIRGPSLHRICRTCAAEVFFWGARNWWIKERAKAVEDGELAEDVRKRKDCENLGHCDQEFDNSHAREFNHIPKPPGVPSMSGTTTALNNTEETSPGESTPPPATEVEASTQNPSETNLNESSAEQPEQSSHAGSLQPEGMEVDAPAATSNPPAPPTLSTDVARSTEGAGADISPNGLPELATESPNVSQASGSTIDPPSDPALPSAAPTEGCSEKIEPERVGDGDIRMTVHEGSEAPIPVSITASTS